MNVSKPGPRATFSSGTEKPKELDALTKPLTSSLKSSRPVLNLSFYSRYLEADLDENLSELLRSAPQASWAEAAVGKSGEERTAGFKMPAPVEAAWSKASLPNGRKEAWKVTLDDGDGYVFAVSPGAKPGTRFAVFNAAGQSLATGYAREVAGKWTIDHVKSKDPVWAFEIKQQQAQQEQAREVELENQRATADASRARILGIKLPPDAAIKNLGLKLTFADGSTRTLKPGDSLMLERNQVSPPATLELLAYAPGPWRSGTTAPGTSGARNTSPSGCA